MYSNFRRLWYEKQRAYNGYEVYVINEFRTSKLCNKCELTYDTFHKRKSEKPKDLDKKRIRGRLLKYRDWYCVPTINVVKFTTEIKIQH